MSVPFHRTKLHLFPSKVTDTVQTIDDHVGIMTKRHMGESFDKWLVAPAGCKCIRCIDASEENKMHKTNLDRMNDGKVSASERRILLTKFLGDAREYVCKNYSFLHSGQKNGCAMDITRDNHSLMRLEGVNGDYSFREAEAEIGEWQQSDTDESDLSDHRSNCGDDSDDLSLDEEKDTPGSDGKNSESESDEDSDTEDIAMLPQNVDDDNNFCVPQGWQVRSTVATAHLYHHQHHDDMIPLMPLRKLR